MKTLTLTQPWASLVADGRKTVETRSWPVAFRGPLAIHAGKGWSRADRQFAFELGYKPEEMVRGAIVCIAYLVDVVPTETFNPAPEERPFGDYSAGRFAWVFDLARLVVLRKPIEATGAQGIWISRDERLNLPVAAR